ncbi:MAG: RidA family protein [Alphaproteobacteria bacterium]
MLRKYNPEGMVAPLSPYSHACEVPPGARWLFIAGQIAIADDGSIPAGIEAQTDMIYQNIGKILKSANMGYEDLVWVNSFLADIEDRIVFNKTRAKYHGDAKPVSASSFVKMLVKPELRVEIQAIAAKV